jgi:hypothetical protein
MRPLPFLRTIALAAGVVSAALPVAAQAQERPQNMIAIQDFSINAADALDGHSIPAMATVTFVNRGTVAATDVLFVLHSRKSWDMAIDDAGKFSPGVTIRHQFQSWDYPDDATVSVAAVRYADGSTWTSEDGRALIERRQAVQGS